METLTIIKESDKPLPNLIPSNVKILAWHQWDTGHQELCFTDRAHFERFKATMEAKSKPSAKRDGGE